MLSSLQNRGILSAVPDIGVAHKQGLNKLRRIESSINLYGDRSGGQDILSSGHVSAFSRHNEKEVLFTATYLGGVTFYVSPTYIRVYTRIKKIRAPLQRIYAMYVPSMIQGA